MEARFFALGIVAIFWAIWKVRNKACFDDKTVKNNVEVLCYACALMKYWSGLYSEEDKAMLEGVNIISQLAKQLLDAGDISQDRVEGWRKQFVGILCFALYGVVV